MSSPAAEGSAAALAPAREAFAAGRIDQAESLCTQHLALSPHDFDALLLLGRCRQRNGDFYGAELSVWQALRADGASIDAQLAYGEVLLDLGNALEAIACLEGAAVRDPNRVDLRFRLGMAYERVGRYAEALVCYEFTRKRGGDPRAAQGRANCLLGLGRLNEAIVALEELLRQQPERAELHANLAVAQANLGDLHGALATIERALALRPDFPEARETRSYLVLQISKKNPAG